MRWFAFLALSTVAFAEEPFAFDKTPGRLPKDAYPRHYAIRIEPDIEGAKFSGSVEIDVETRKPLGKLVLNSLGLEIAGASANGTAVEAIADNGSQLLTLTPQTELPAGKHRVRIEFRGRLNEAPEGIYITRYQMPDGSWHKALATQMEPSDARRMFPCWDEPVFRSTFQLTAIVPANHTALFNAPQTTDRALDGGKREIAFGTSPAMPSYLVAFVSSELDALRDKIGAVDLGLFATPGKKEHLPYALDATKKVLPFFDDYFGAKYSLPKLDQVSFPSVGAGGMENWGCIIYADNAFLLHPKEQTFQDRRAVFGIVAHEIAHQWFGNLVTMAWWDNLWLNEGFASWMATKASDHFNPEWKVWTTAAGGKETAMRLDARSTTHPIQQPVANESEAENAFDEITYQKGQAFLRMLETWLGEEAFRDGMRLYFKRHAMGNTTTADLWKALEDSSGKQVRAMAAGWTNQPGFPVVRVNADRDGNVTLAQERFTIHQKSPTPLDWIVPANTKTFPAGEAVVHVVGPKPLTIPKSKLPIVVNSGGAGYFRVSYEGEAWEQLKLNLTRLPEVDQIIIVQDTWALVLSGRAPLARWFEIAELLRNEATPLVASELARPLGSLDDLLRGDDRRPAFRAKAAKLLEPIVRRSGWEPRAGEEPAAESLRIQLIGMLGSWGISSFRTEIEKRLSQYLANADSLRPPLRGVVLTVGGHTASPEVWEQLHTRAKQTVDSDHKAELYRALTQTHEPALARKALAISLGDELPARQSTRLVRDVASAHFPELAWKFAQQNLPALLSRMTSNDANRFAPSLFSAFSDEERAVELEEFVKANLPAAAQRATSLATEEIRFKAESKRRLLPQLDAWMM
ncbi:MAG: hypothetical protein RL088_2120 [Verrucomicrobiota bacterium]|jgi:aminopeptidase N